MCSVQSYRIRCIRTQEIARQTIVPFKKKCFGEAIDKGHTSFAHVIQTILGNPQLQRKRQVVYEVAGNLLLPTSCQEWAQGLPTNITYPMTT